MFCSLWFSSFLIYLCFLFPFLCRIWCSRTKQASKHASRWCQRTVMQWIIEHADKWVQVSGVWCFPRGHSPEDLTMVFLCRVRPDARLDFALRNVIADSSWVEPRPGRHPRQMLCHIHVTNCWSVVWAFSRCNLSDKWALSGCNTCEKCIFKMQLKWKMSIRKMQQTLKNWASASSQWCYFPFLFLGDVAFPSFFPCWWMNLPPWRKWCLPLPSSFGVDVVSPSFFCVVLFIFSPLGGDASLVMLLPTSCFGVWCFPLVDPFGWCCLLLTLLGGAAFTPNKYL